MNYDVFKAQVWNKSKKSVIIGVSCNLNKITNNSILVWGIYFTFLLY